MVFQTIFEDTVLQRRRNAHYKSHASENIGPGHGCTVCLIFLESRIRIEPYAQIINYFQVTMPQGSASWVEYILMFQEVPEEGNLPF